MHLLSFLAHCLPKKKPLPWWRQIKYWRYYVIVCVLTLKFRFFFVFFYCWLLPCHRRKLVTHPHKPLNSPLCVVNREGQWSRQAQCSPAAITKQELMLKRLKMCVSFGVLLILLYLSLTAIKVVYVCWPFALFAFFLLVQPLSESFSVTVATVGCQSKCSAASGMLIHFWTPEPGNPTPPTRHPLCCILL